MPLHEAGGILGKIYPWLSHSEILHYLYAIFMLIGLFYFRRMFNGKSRYWWTIAIIIQFWHHIEHLLLLYQSIIGNNFFGASQPISIIQFTGFFYGTPEDNFGGLLKMSHFGQCTCENAMPGTIHEFSWRMLTVRRPEVHMIYNILVTIPMVIAILIRKKNDIKSV